MADFQLSVDCLTLELAEFAAQAPNLRLSRDVLVRQDSD